MSISNFYTNYVKNRPENIYLDIVHIACSTYNLCYLYRHVLHDTGNTDKFAINFSKTWANEHSYDLLRSMYASVHKLSPFLANNGELNVY